MGGDYHGLVVHFINVTIKQPRFGRAIGWHRDYPNTAYCTAQSDFLRLMLCLDGMAADSGATRFLPASHGISDAQAASDKDHGTWPRPAADDGICLACAPGQLVAIHPKVLHGGGMNTSERPRRNIVIQVGKASAALTTDDRDLLTGMLLG